MDLRPPILLRRRLEALGAGIPEGGLLITFSRLSIRGSIDFRPRGGRLLLREAGEAARAEGPMDWRLLLPLRFWEGISPSVMRRLGVLGGMVIIRALSNLKFVSSFLVAQPKSTWFPVDSLSLNRLYTTRQQALQSGNRDDYYFKAVKNCVAWSVSTLFVLSLVTFKNSRYFPVSC